VKPHDRSATPPRRKKPAAGMQSLDAFEGGICYEVLGTRGGSRKRGGTAAIDQCAPPSESPGRSTARRPLIGNGAEEGRPRPSRLDRGAQGDRGQKRLRVSDRTSRPTNVARGPWRGRRAPPPRVQGVELVRAELHQAPRRGRADVESVARRSIPKTGWGLAPRDRRRTLLQLRRFANHSAERAFTFIRRCHVDARPLPRPTSRWMTAVPARALRHRRPGSRGGGPPPHVWAGPVDEPEVEEHRCPEGRKVTSCSGAPRRPRPSRDRAG